MELPVETWKDVLIVLQVYLDTEDSRPGRATTFNNVLAVEKQLEKALTPP